MNVDFVGKAVGNIEWMVILGTYALINPKAVFEKWKKMKWETIRSWNDVPLIEAFYHKAHTMAKQCPAVLTLEKLGLQLEIKHETVVLLFYMFYYSWCIWMYCIHWIFINTFTHWWFFKSTVLHRISQTKTWNNWSILFRLQKWTLQSKYNIQLQPKAGSLKQNPSSQPLVKVTYNLSLICEQKLTKNVSIFMHKKQ